MAQRQAVLGEQRLGLGAAQARLRGSRSSRPSSTASSRFIRTRSRLTTPAKPSRRARQAAGHAGAAAERDDRDPVLGRPGQDGGDLVVPVGAHHGVGGVGEVAGAQRAAGRAWTCRGCAGVRVSSSTRTCSAPTISASPSSRCVVQRGRRGGVAPATAGRSWRPKASSTRPRADSGSVGGGGRVAPALRVHLDSGRLDGHALQCDTCRHFVTIPGSSADDAYLDAARDCILDVGWRRTTLTDVARRAGVSRMTIYRAWSDMGSLLGDLMTREWVGIAAATRVAARRHHDPGRIAAAALSHRAGAARQRAVRPHRRARPRPAAPLPARPARPLARRRSSRSSPPRSQSGQRDRRDPRRRPGPDGARAALAGHGFVLLGRMTMIDAGVGLDRPRRGVRAELITCVPRAGYDAVHRRTRITPGLAGVPDARRRPWSSASASPAPGSPSTPSPAACSVLAVDAHDLAFGTSRWSLQARARRAALPRPGPARRRPRERRRARHPDGASPRRTWSARCRC